MVVYNLINSDYLFSCADGNSNDEIRGRYWPYFEVDNKETSLPFNNRCRFLCLEKFFVSNNKYFFSSIKALCWWLGPWLSLY